MIVLLIYSFLLSPSVNTDNIVDPTLRSKPNLVVGMPVLLATFVFKPLIPTARFSENDNPFIIVHILINRLQNYCFFFIRAKSFLVLFACAFVRLAKLLYLCSTF
jgi:amino acid permease